MKLATSMMFILLLASTFVITLGAVPAALAQDESYELLNDIGTHFELQHFSVSITTDVAVHVVLRASCEMLDYFIENAGEATCTQLILENLQPLATYYRYEDSYVNEIVFVTDANGSHTYTQDLTGFHHIFIQPSSSTIFISEDTTLQSNIYDSVEIIADNVILDLNGYSIIGQGWAIGIVLHEREGVTIKNGVVMNFWAGIHLALSEGNTISGINLDSNIITGLELSGSDNNVITDNTIDSNSWGIDFMGSQFNVITNNNIQNNNVGLKLFLSAWRNKIHHNNFFNNYDHVESGAIGNLWDDGYPSGGNYWDDYAGTDHYSGPYQNEPGSDGIGDTPYVTETAGWDMYPLVEPFAQALIQNEILFIKSWHLNHGVEQSLIGKLEDAVTLLNKWNINGAIRKMQDLIKKVENDASHLTQEQKAYIIQTTQQIVDLIG